MKKTKIEINEMGSGIYLYTQDSYPDIKYLVMVSGYSPFLQIENVFNLSDNRIVSKDKLRGNKFTIEKINFNEVSKINKNTRLEVKIDINTPFHRHLRGSNGTVESFSKNYGVTPEYFIKCWNERGGENIIQEFFKLQEIL